MHSDLSRMANDIARNFCYEPPDRAAEKVAEHIRLFWAPSMRAELLQDPASPDLDPVVVEAVRRLQREEGNVQTATTKSVK